MSEHDDEVWRQLERVKLEAAFSQEVPFLGPDGPVEAPLAIPEGPIRKSLGPDAIIKTDGPTIIGHNRMGIDPVARETWEQEKVDWAYPSVGRSEDPDLPLNPMPEQGPLRDWTPLPWVATNAVEHEFDTLERYLKELIKAHDDQYAQGNYDEITVKRITLGAAIGQAQRLIERYKELYKIASSVVNAEQLRRFE